jgi:hypothetical protein
MASIRAIVLQPWWRGYLLGTAAAQWPSSNTLEGLAMIHGASLPAFTLLHTVISLIGLFTGAVVVTLMLRGRKSPVWTAMFLAATVVTSVTGFMFPSASFGPAHVAGVISLAMLAIAIFALYGRQIAGVWRPVFIVAALAALYLNVFVGVLQAFQKVPGFRAMATQSELPFMVAQTGVLIFFVAIGVIALFRYRPLGRVAA